MEKLAKILLKINENYTNYNVRYLLVLEALILAKELGLECGFRFDKNEPEWPIIAIQLSDNIGQVSWHMPPSEIKYDHFYRNDNSTPQDCQNRCNEFAQKYLKTL